MRINLTQHKSTPEQECIEVEKREELLKLLTFEELPDRQEILRRAVALANLAVAHGATEAMIGGAPWLMSALEICLRIHRVEPVYAFSTRESVEETQADGSVRKVSVFVHKGFIR